MSSTRQVPGTDPWWAPAGSSAAHGDDAQGAGESFAPPRAPLDDVAGAELPPVDGPDDGPGDAGPAGHPAAAPPLPLTRDGRRARAPRPGALPPARAVTGALVAVAGVVLGIGTLLWATGGIEGPAAGDPVVRPPAEVRTASDAPAPASEALPFDEPAVPAPDALDEAAPPAAAPVPSPVPPPPPAPAPVTQAAPAPPLEVPVLVLNNSRVEGLAEDASRWLEAGGWPVRETGSLRGRIRATTVYFPPGQEAAARELARRFPWVRRVLPRLEGLPGTGLTVVVTRDALG